MVASCGCVVGRRTGGRAGVRLAGVLWLPAGPEATVGAASRRPGESDGGPGKGVAVGVAVTDAGGLLWCVHGEDRNQSVGINLRGQINFAVAAAGLDVQEAGFAAADLAIAIINFDLDCHSTATAVGNRRDRVD